MNHLSMFNSIRFSKFVELCNHPQNPVLKYFRKLHGACLPSPVPVVCLCCDVHSCCLTRNEWTVFEPCGWLTSQNSLLIPGWSAVPVPVANRTITSGYWSCWFCFLASNHVQIKGAPFNGEESCWGSLPALPWLKDPIERGV